MISAAIKRTYQELSDLDLDAPKTGTSTDEHGKDSDTLADEQRDETLQEVVAKLVRLGINIPITPTNRHTPRGTTHSIPPLKTVGLYLLVCVYWLG